MLNDDPRKDDPFRDLRPALPEDLDRLLDEAPLRQAVITGPGLRWVESPESDD